MRTGVIGGVCTTHAPQLWTLPESEDKDVVERVRNVCREAGRKRILGRFRSPSSSSRTWRINSDRSSPELMPSTRAASSMLYSDFDVGRCKRIGVRRRDFLNSSARWSS